MNVLTMQDVRKSFGSLEVLKGISLTVGEGEAVSVIGPSGSGKSTLLRCATLLETMDGGSLAYGNDFAATMDAEGKSVYADKAALRRIKSRFGLVFQQFNLFPHYTVLKNVTDAPLIVQKRERGEVRELALSLLEKMGLADKADAYPCQLSGGQQQRVAIARALALRPDILFFDEPTSALDPTTTTSILNLLREINRRMGITIVIITHEMSVVESTCTHVAIIDDGQLAECGTVESVFSQPKSAAAKKLIFRTAGADSGAMGERMIRIVFEGSSADEPTISDLAMQCHVAVNIRYADTREVSGKLFGQMILQLPEDHLQQEKAIYFLQNKGLRVEEVNGHVHG